ncbi:MAG: TIGR00730 family Rossman fold protein [Phototrophicaceae bacterium]
MKRICVFCGASTGNNPAYQAAAVAMGKTLAENGIDLVYGGGNKGLMGMVADATIDNGGRAFGVIPKALVDKEEAHTRLSEQFIVNTMHERKMMMATLSDGFIAMPGGFGTLEEFIEIITWAKLGFHQKPCALLNINNFYDGLLTYFDQLTEEGFVKPKMRDLVLTADSPQSVLVAMQNFVPLDLTPILQEGDI